MCIVIVILTIPASIGGTTVLLISVRLPIIYSVRFARPG